MRERWFRLLLCVLLVQLSGCGYREDEERPNTTLPDSAAENDFYGMDFGNGSESTSGIKKKTLPDSAAENDFYEMDFGNGSESTSGMKKIRRVRATVEEDLEVAQKAYDKADKEMKEAVNTNDTATSDYIKKKGIREEADRNLTRSENVLKEAEGNKTKADEELSAAKEYLRLNTTAVKNAEEVYKIDETYTPALDKLNDAKEKKDRAEENFFNTQGAVNRFVKFIKEKTEERDAAKKVAEDKLKEEKTAYETMQTANNNVINAKSVWSSAKLDKLAKEEALKEELEKRTSSSKITTAVGVTIGILVVAAIGGVGSPVWDH